MDHALASMHDLHELMRCAPSTRRFSDEPVSREALERALDNARFAPSGGNRQPWRVIVVTGQATRTTLRELYVPHWEAYFAATGGARLLADGEASGLAPQQLGRLRAVDEFARSFDSAPVHLVVCVELSALAVTDAALARTSVVGGASIYPFVQNLLLALRAEDLGAAFTTLLVPAEPQVRELLAIPGEFALAGHITVGHRADPWPKRLSRRPVESFAFSERFGGPWTAR